MIPQLAAQAAPQTRTLLDPFAFVGTLAILWAWLPYLAFNTIEVEQFTGELLVACGILGYCGFRLAWLAGQGRPRFLVITFFAFMYVWVGLAATAQTAMNHLPWRSVHLPGDVLPALLQAALAIAAFDLGYLSLNWRRRIPRSPVMFQRYSVFISDKAAAWLTVGALVLSLIGIILFGPGNLLLTRGQAADAATQVSSTMSLSLIAEKILRVPSLVAFNVVAYNAITRWRTLDGLRKRFYFSAICVLLPLMFITNYPPALTRHWLGVVLFTQAFALIPWRRWLAPFWVLSLSAGLAIAFPYLDLFRHATSISDAFDKLEIGGTVLEPLLSGHYDAWQLSLNGYAYTQQYGVEWGRNLMGAALFWVPRSFWPDKPYGTGMEICKIFGYDFLNLSAPLWMEFNVAFGWLGIAVLMFLYARLGAWAENLYENSQAQGGTSHLSRLLVPYWGSFQIFILRGDLMSATAYASFGLALYLLAALPSRMLVRGVPPAPLMLRRP